MRDLAYVQVRINNRSFDVVEESNDSANLESCTSSDPCETQPCLHSGICIRTKNTDIRFQCICQSGFTGSTISLSNETYLKSILHSGKLCESESDEPLPNIDYIMSLNDRNDNLPTTSTKSVKFGISTTEEIATTQLISWWDFLKPNKAQPCENETQCGPHGTCSLDHSSIITCNCPIGSFGENCEHGKDVKCKHFSYITGQYVLICSSWITGL